MWSLGFGLERVAWPALIRPRLVAAIVIAVTIVAIYGATRVTFDDNLRGVFAGSSEAYRNYIYVTEEFDDPENELILLVEGKDLGSPAVLARLMDLQLQLQLLDGVESVFSMFALREAPDADGDAPLVVEDTTAGLTPALVTKIRTHPMLGARLLSADAKSLLYVITPAERKAALPVIRELSAEIEATAKESLDGTATATLTGFPALRAGIIDIITSDQMVLNGAGAAIGFFLSLIVFRSFIAALMTSIPAILGGILVIGALGLLGLPVTAMSNVVPALVMIVGYADGIHLSHSWRHHRDAGASPVEAAWRAQSEVGAACMLTALTTSASFLSLTFTDVSVVNGFGWIGAVAMLAGGWIVLIVHSLLAVFIGKYWRRSTVSIPDWFAPLAGPSAAICRFGVSHARPIAIIVGGAFVVLSAAYYQLPAEHSIREHLPKDNPANAALGRIDQNFGGALPLQIVVPLNGLSPTSPEGLARIGAVHQAVAGVKGLEEPLSLWTLVKWLGGKNDQATADRVSQILDELSPAARERFLSKSGSTLISTSVHDAPTYLMTPLVNEVERVAKQAGGENVMVTGVTVVTTLESVRTIANLNVSLTFAIFADLSIMMLAFRNWTIGALAVFSNTLPVLGTCALLLVLGKGMQFNSVVALIVAFGVTVDETTHYLNRLLNGGDPLRPLGERLVDTSRHIGPVLIGTTVIIIAGLSSTLASGLPTIRLFGGITAITLLFALGCDLLVLPALIAGPARRWFENRRPSFTPAVGKEPA